MGTALSVVSVSARYFSLLHVSGPFLSLDALLTSMHSSLLYKSLKGL